MSTCPERRSSEEEAQPQLQSPGSNRASNGPSSERRGLCTPRGKDRYGLGCLCRARALCDRVGPSTRANRASREFRRGARGGHVVSHGLDRRRHHVCARGNAGNTPPVRHRRTQCSSFFHTEIRWPPRIDGVVTTGRRGPRASVSPYLLTARPFFVASPTAPQHEARSREATAPMDHFENACMQADVPA